MHKIFSEDSPVMQIFGRIADLFILNIAFLIFCLPIITIGPATAALYALTQKIKRNESPTVIKTFWTEFKRNLKQGILIQLFLMMGGVLVFTNFQCLTLLVELEANAFLCLTILFCLMVLISAFWLILVLVYPILSRFEGNVRKTISTAFLLAIRHFITTMQLSAIAALPLLSIALLGQVPIVLLVMVTFGFSGIAYLQTPCLLKLFKKYEN